MNYRNYCSPLNRVNNDNNFSCYNNDSIIELANAYNKYIKKKNVKNICNGKICIKNKIININNSIEEIYIELINRLKKIYPMEYNWINLPFVDEITNIKKKSSIKKGTFLPEQPENRHDWLTSDNLNNSINQYEELFNYIAKKKGLVLNFKFLGTQPSDISKISNISWKQFEKYDTLAIIFNTDKHNQPGQHWLAVYINNLIKEIEYFDSLGNSPNKNIRHFFKKLIKKHYSFKYNTKEFQKGGSQCGQYALTFIKEKLNGKTWSEIINNKELLNDKEMIKERDKFFIPNLTNKNI